MGNAKKKDLKLELLVATMNRSSLDFLAELFPFGNYQKFNILVINQTDEFKILESQIDNIKIINSFEKGLARSRNTAILNASGDVCLLVDDDVKFNLDFENTIIEAYHNNPNASIITFKMEDFDGNLFKNYPDVKHHNLDSIKEVNSVVVSFNRELILKSGLLFDINFGLGAIFQTADEYVFMREALRLNLEAIFEPEVILSHPYFSSGKDEGSDRLIYARSAVFYKYSGVLGYLKLCKHLYLLNNQDRIKREEIIKKFKVGLSGIKKYKALSN